MEGGRVERAQPADRSARSRARPSGSSTADHEAGRRGPRACEMRRRLPLSAPRTVSLRPAWCDAAVADQPPLQAIPELAPLKKLKVLELRTLCEAHNLDKAGNKEVMDKLRDMKKAAAARQNRPQEKLTERQKSSAGWRSSGGSRTGGGSTRK